MKSTSNIITKIYTRILYAFGKSKPKTVEPIVKEDCIINQYNQKLVVGSRVLVRSNEPDALGIAHIIEFYDCNGKWREPIPIVVYEGDDETPYMCMAIIITYDETLFNFLSDFAPIEQWNILARDFNQLEEKYGVKYRTVSEIRKVVTIPTIC